VGVQGGEIASALMGILQPVHTVLNGSVDGEAACGPARLVRA
jgi:hypothetical protein